MKEIWKDVVGYEGLYQISSFGRLKHFSTRFGWNILKNTNKKGWYFNVVLRSKNGNRSVKLHRLVAEAFIPNPENKREINHIDLNKQNNRVENLEWCSHKENIQHYIKLAYPEKTDRPINRKRKNKSIKKNNNIPQVVVNRRIYHSRKVLQYSMNGEFLNLFESAKSASKITGVCLRNIHQVASKEPFNSKGAVRKQAGGFIWKYA